MVGDGGPNSGPVNALAPPVGGGCGGAGRRWLGWVAGVGVGVRRGVEALGDSCEPGCGTSAHVGRVVWRLEPGGCGGGGWLAPGKRLRYRQCRPKCAWLDGAAGRFILNPGARMPAARRAGAKPFFCAGASPRGRGRRAESGWVVLLGVSTVIRLGPRGWSRGCISSLVGHTPRHDLDPRPISARPVIWTKRR